jgi:hypothetical protein
VRFSAILIKSLTIDKFCHVLPPVFAYPAINPATWRVWQLGKEHTMAALQLGTALKLVIKTGPILLVRLGMYLLFWLVTLIYLGIVIGLAALLGSITPLLGWVVAIAGLIGYGPIYQLAYKYVFFLIKAAHIAVISELLVHSQLPAGVSQLAWGKQQVRQRFGDVTAMFVVDELVSGIVRAFTRTVYNLASWLPGDTMRQLAAVANRVVRYATSYIDEAIMARSFWRRDENTWTSAEEGVVLYGQVWKPLLKNAIALMLLSYIPFIIALVLFAAPVGGLIGLIFGSKAAAWSVLASLVLAFLIKVAVGDGFAMTAMIAAYQRETANLQPDPAMSAQLSQVSAKFVELKQRAMAAMPSAQPSYAPQAAAPVAPAQPR